MAKIPFRNNLFAKSFIAITLGLILWLPLFYLFIVTMANRFALQMEEQSGRTILNNVYQMVMQSSKDLKSWERSALEAHKRELHNIILLIRSYIQESQLIMTRENLTLEQTQKRVLESLRNFKYGNNDYIFVSDYNNVLISHPDDKLLNNDFSEVKDVKGSLIVPPMITGARIKGEGFYSYWWRRLDKEEPVEKLSHYRDIAEWDWVIATSVYIDDIREEVQRRKGELVETLRVHFHSTTVAKSEYVRI